MKPQELTRKNSVLWTENDRWQNGIYIRRAIIWGSRDAVSFQEILDAWFSKPRKVDVSVMLANVINESGRCPWIARYEIGQHVDNRGFMGGQYFGKPNTEFECTSFGLFQPMGFNLYPKYVAVKSENCFKDLTLEIQFDWFDDFMDNCFAIAREYAKANKKAKDIAFIVESAIASYAGNVAYRNWVITKKLNTWKSIEAKEKFALQRVGFTEEEIKFLFKNDKT